MNVIAKEVYEFTPFKKMGDISFNNTEQDLIKKNFFVPEWWKASDFSPTEILYKDQNDQLSVYFDSEDSIDNKLEISSIHCCGLISYRGVIITGKSCAKIDHIFGKPDEVDEEYGAYFNDGSEQEVIRVYDYYGLMAFFRRNRLHAVAISAEYDD